MKKRIGCVLLALWVLSAALSGCASKIPEEQLPAAETLPDATAYEAALETYFSLYWHADPAAVDAAMPSTLWDWLLTEGYPTKQETTDYVAKQQTALQEKIFGAQIDTYEYVVADEVVFSDEDAAAYVKTTTFAFGIDTAAVSSVTMLTVDSIGTTVAGEQIPVDAITLHVIEMNGTYYIAESIDRVIDLSYQLWTLT